MVDIIDNLTGKVIGEGSVTNTRHFPEEISAIRNADQDAIEIGNLFRRATGRSENHRCNSGASHPTPDDQKQTTVTSIRHFSGRMSGSRNADRQPDKYPEGSNGWLCEQPSSGDVCYYCRERFEPGQMRYRIMNAVNSAPHGWGPAVLCMGYFKAETDVSVLGLGPGGQPASRHTMQCAGCSEYISTIRNPRHQQWNFCSNRCYQRTYRRRRRGRDSVVGWKLENRRSNNHCEACKKLIDVYGESNKRKDAKFCSNKCRQWHYRRTRQV